MTEHEEAPNWHRALAQAPFTIYGPTIPTPGSLWAGGFGYSGRAPDHIGVMADIDGVEVAVDTASERRVPADLRQRGRSPT